jgi:tetratricopeptide (TPR) repeat protein
MTQLCDEDTLNALIQDMRTEPHEQLDRLEALLLDFPDDARLHFLHGSTLIGVGRLIEAHRSMTRAVAIAPDFWIARFQLGFFQLTSGEAENALETFGRLDRLPDGHYLRKFVDGLRCLIRDDFTGAIEGLRQGIALNTENPPLNNDMQLIIDRCAQAAGAGSGDDGPVSETSLILHQFSDRQKMN